MLVPVFKSLPTIADAVRSPHILWLHRAVYKCSTAKAERFVYHVPAGSPSRGGTVTAYVLE